MTSEQLATWSGLEILEAQSDGRVAASPIQRLTGLRPTAASEGRCDFVLPASPWLASPTGNVHGGAIVLLADGALSGAMQTTIPAGAGLSMLDNKTYFIRPAVADGSVLSAKASVVRRGRTMAVARCELTNETGKAVAIGTGSAMIVEMDAQGLPLP